MGAAPAATLVELARRSDPSAVWEAPPEKRRLLIRAEAPHVAEWALALPEHRTLDALCKCVGFRSFLRTYHFFERTVTGRRCRIAAQIGVGSGHGSIGLPSGGAGPGRSSTVG
jgi:hypothetical protein